MNRMNFLNNTWVTLVLSKPNKFIDILQKKQKIFFTSDQFLLSLIY